MQFSRRHRKGFTLVELSSTGNRRDHASSRINFDGFAIGD